MTSILHKVLEGNSGYDDSWYDAIWNFLILEPLIDPRNLVYYALLFSEIEEKRITFKGGLLMDKKAFLRYYFETLCWSKAKLFEAKIWNQLWHWNICRIPQKRMR